MRVFRLRMVAAKNSRKRRAARSPASATIPGTTTAPDASIETRAGGLTVSWRVGSGSVSGSSLGMTEDGQTHCRIVQQTRLLTRPLTHERNRRLRSQSKLGQLLDCVEAGEEIIITRRGKAVARMISADAVFDRERARGAAARIRGRRRGMTLGGITIKDLINEGR